MAPIDQGLVWAEASSPPIVSLVRRFTDDWRGRTSDPPDPKEYLPDDLDRRASALLGLLRADLGLRWKAGEPARVERYLRWFPDLAEEVLVALLYEEFCLREEAGETPHVSEYQARFPSAAGQIRELLDIHEFVGATRSRQTWSEPLAPADTFPAVGETIGGFRLLEELGRGGIARVFLAQEHRLADRRVALKVSRAGSREPQTLASLQHTNIVPVHSYRVDKVSGLHLLCMPFLGRVTLGDLLANPRTRLARTGVDLLAVLDGLRPAGDQVPLVSFRSAARQALHGLSIAQAIAWWAARLAEALQHAHNSGVLHRDIKPSNVLITADATPMLLDFNLARPSDLDGRGATGFGGTLGYMAPEHIAALAALGNGRSGQDSVVDARADIYSLGVVVYEALALRPFLPPAFCRDETASWLSMLAKRAPPVPPRRIEASGRNVPAALRAVVARCLEPNPANRYASAAQVAIDLQAVADDDALCFAREPQPSRTIRWLWRNRRSLAITLGILAATVTLFSAQAATLRRQGMARAVFDAGLRSAAAGEFTAAAAQFALAAERASGSWDTALRSLAAEARRRRQDALDTARICDRVDAFLMRAESMRFRLITREGLDSISHDLKDAFAEFRVFEPALWTRDPELERLDPNRRARLIAEINELLFLWVVAADRPDDPQGARRAAAICEKALAFAEPNAPWLALQARYDGRDRDARRVSPPPSAETSARGCFEWALLRVCEDRPDLALAWFEQAAALEPDRFWYQFALAFHHALYGDASKAMEHYTAAVALRPDSSWALLNRAQLASSRLGAWELAMRDLDRVRAHPDGLDPRRLQLELGRVAERLGDFPTALANFEAVIASDNGGELARPARLNRARVESELGPCGRSHAWSDYETLLAADPDDAEARIGRALLALRIGRPAVADGDLTTLLGSHAADASARRKRADWLAVRALSRLAQRRPDEAARDAEEAIRIAATPGRLRVFTRVAIAAGRESKLGTIDPDDLDRLPAAGSALAIDLQSAVARLGAGCEAQTQTRDGAAHLSSRIARAAMLSALGDHAAALADADKAVGLDPSSAEAWLLRARVRRRAGDPESASADITRGLAVAPGDSRLQILRGRLLLEQGHPLAAIAALDLALAAGAGGPAHAARAQASFALNQVERAIGDWTIALRDDPEDATAFLARARCFIRRAHWDAALADLESAVDCSGNRPEVLIPTAISCAACLPQRPGHLSRVVGLVCRAAGSLLR
jgi:eukaryotic-like serine/threonine-protein kinase